MGPIYMLLVSGVVAVAHVVVQPVAQVPADRAAIDPIVTGRSVSAEHLQAFETRREAYRACPDCAAAQPFPGGELPDQ